MKWGNQQLTQSHAQKHVMLTSHRASWSWKENVSVILALRPPNPCRCAAQNNENSRQLGCLVASDSKGHVWFTSCWQLLLEIPEKDDAMVATPWRKEGPEAGMWSRRRRSQDPKWAEEGGCQDNWQESVRRRRSCDPEAFINHCTNLQKSESRWGFGFRWLTTLHQSEPRIWGFRWLTTLHQSEPRISEEKQKCERTYVR